MTVRLNSALRNAMMNTYGFVPMMNFGVIKVFSGPPPQTADGAEQGVLLATITQDGLAFEPGQQEGGLSLRPGPVVGAVSNLGTWVLRGRASGAAGWWRWCWNGIDHGEVNENVPRVDAAIGVGLVLPNPTISPATDEALSSFSVHLPPYF